MPVSRPVGGEGLNRYVRTGYAGVPAVRLLGDGHRLGRAIEGARPTHGHAPDLRQDQVAIVETDAAMLADLRIGEAVVATPPSEAGIARCLAGSHATEERLEGAIQSREHILQDLRVDLRVLGESAFQVGQFGLLLGVRGTPACSASPPRLALLKGGVRERAAMPQDGFQRLFLFGQWLQFVPVGLADCRPCPSATFCLLGGKAARSGNLAARTGHPACIPMPEGRVPQPRGVLAQMGRGMSLASPCGPLYNQVIPSAPRRSAGRVGLRGRAMRWSVARAG